MTEQLNWTELIITRNQKNVSSLWKFYQTHSHKIHFRITVLEFNNRKILPDPLRNLYSKTSGFSSVAQSCPTLCDRMNRSTPGLLVHHHLPEFTQSHIHRVRDAIQPSHTGSSPSPPALNPNQHQSLFQRVNSSHEAAKVLEFQLICLFVQVQIL